jgi:hypothetical protein
MPAPSKYNPAYHDDWAWSLAIKGATNDEIAEAFGISTRTFIRWKQEYESLDKAVTEGKDIADAKVERSLYQRATGYKVVDTEKIIELNPSDGSQKPIRVKNVEKNIAPDTMAIMYWLNNRKRTHWSQRQEVALSAGDNSEDVVIYLPANGRDAEDEQQP